MICAVTDGDITKRNYIYYNCTLNDVLMYLEHQTRKILFREAVIKFLLGDTEKDKRMMDDYCKICKSKNKNPDCKGCKREIVNA